jgi:hypothetical protein
LQTSVINRSFDNEQKNSLNTKSYYPSDAHDTNVKGKYASLVFHLDTVMMKDANDLNKINKDSFYSKALPAKIDNEKLSPYFAFRPHDVIQNTLRQTTQLSKSTIHYLYLDPVSKLPWSETTERPGYFVGFADNIGDALTFKILKNDLVTVIHRSGGVIWIEE